MYLTVSHSGEEVNYTRADNLLSILQLIDEFEFFSSSEKIDGPDCFI